MKVLEDYILHNFINKVMYRGTLNQLQAVVIWDKIKYHYDMTLRREFEIEWGHYKLGELTANEFAQYINILKR